MKNNSCTIGLFQGMFEDNIMTFNPGWNENAEALENYTDVRDIQKKLMNDGIKIEHQIEADSTGPASFVIKDPDGNVILFDQHV